MIDTFRRHRDPLQTPEDIAHFIDEWLRVVGPQVQGALISTAWKAPGGESSFLTGRVHMHEQQATPRATHCYPSVRLEESWIGRDQISKFLAGLVIGDASERSLPEGFQPPGVEQIYSVDAFETHTRWPETHLKFWSTANNRPAPEWAPAVKPGLPPFLTWAQAAANWLSIREVAYGTDIPYSGYLVVILPDKRGRALKVSGHEQGLEIQCELRGDCEEYELHSVFSRSRRHLESHVSPIGPAGLAIAPLCREATQLDVFCVKRDYGVISHKHFTWDDLPDASQPDPDADQEYQHDVACGENEHVEFKPFIAAGNDKLMEIVKVVIAFANSSGGRIYVGIQDDGRPEGRSALRKQGKGNDPSGLETMRGRLRKVVSDNIKPVPRTTVVPWEFRGEPVLILEVPPGDDFYSTRDNDFWVRKGSSNFRPDPQTELETLMARRRSAGGTTLDDIL